VLTALLGSLAPFAVTWEVYPEWFTLHAVPFLVVAAVSFVCTTLATLHAWVREGEALGPRRVSSRGELWRRWLCFSPCLARCTRSRR
jgi:hypothetical protein